MKLLTLAVLTAVIQLVFAGMVHQIQVGPGGQLAFMPNSITIFLGDSVEWDFVSAGHNVAQAAAQPPCMVLPGGFKSTLPLYNVSQSFTWTPPTADVFYFLCTVPGHCQEGMSGMIIVASNNAGDNSAVSSSSKATSTSALPTSSQSSASRFTSSALAIGMLITVAGAFLVL